MTHEFTLRIRITSQRIAAAIALFLLAGVPRVCSTADYQDISTITTFHPQPTATFGSPGTDTSPALLVTGQTTIGRDSGTVTFGHTDLATTRVFAGGTWSDSNELRVKGGLRVDGCIWLKNYKAPGQPRREVNPATGAITDITAAAGNTYWRCRWQP